MTILPADEATLTSPEYRETFESFTAHGNRVVCYSCHEWSSTWNDICIERRLMKTAKLEGGGRMRNGDSGHKCWIQSLNHFSYINYCMEGGI